MLGIVLSEVAKVL